MCDAKLTLGLGAVFFFFFFWGRSQNWTARGSAIFRKPFCQAWVSFSVREGNIQKSCTIRTKTSVGRSYNWNTGTDPIETFSTYIQIMILQYKTIWCFHLNSWGHSEQRSFEQKIAQTKTKSQENEVKAVILIQNSSFDTWNAFCHF